MPGTLVPPIFLATGGEGDVEATGEVLVQPGQCQMLLTKRTRSFLPAI